MKIFRFELEGSRPIEHFGSVNVVLSRIAHLRGNAWVSCIHIGPNGTLGYHRATVPQLFLVVQGEGWVRGESPEPLSITPGYAAFWEKDEWHESGTKSGMTAIVIEVERDTFDAGEFLQEEKPRKSL